MTVTVLYFMGWCRSGTTLLGNILNEIPSTVHVGELCYLWGNGVLREGTNAACGCGQDLLTCQVWRRVLAASCPAGVRPRSHALAVTRWQSARFRTRHTPWRLRSTDCARSDTAINGYVDALSATYRAVAAVTTAKVVVDTSKYPAHAAVLDRLGSVDPYFVHMVRDPRATAHSWSTPKAYIPRMGPLRGTGNWLAFNVASEMVARRWRSRTLSVRYESFARRPRATVQRILDLLGLDAENPVHDDGTVRLGGNHTVTGNPDRFAHGLIAVREDARWRQEMRRRHRVIVTTAAAPMLDRYGYARARNGCTRSVAAR